MAIAPPHRAMRCFRLARRALVMKSWAVGEVFGEETEKDVRTAVAQLDPTNPSSAVGGVVAGVAGAVDKYNPFKGLW